MRLQSRARPGPEIYLACIPSDVEFCICRSDPRRVPLEYQESVDKPHETYDARFRPLASGEGGSSHERRSGSGGIRQVYLRSVIRFKLGEARSIYDSILWEREFMLVGWAET